ncbi:hypothetical protein DFH29DRAFT_549807 [Suillus ampliporus]|nr:hypothetical protein DFH29DRAFT_549807 [Suillus ampliporus]
MAVVDISNTFGAGFIGGMVTAILYGITTLQTYLYYVYYPRDSKNLKVLVAIVWVIDTLHVCLMCHALYHYLVSSFGDPDALNTGVWSLFTSIGLNLCMAVLVQTYFAFQILYLSRSSIRWWLTGFIMLFVVAHFGFGLETVVLMFIKKEFSALSQITLYAATPFSVTTVLSDVLIAVTLCVLLYDNRSPVVERSQSRTTGIAEMINNRTNALVNTLIVYAINRCLLTSAVAVAEVIVFVIIPGSLWFIAMDFVIGKLYANSLLASLNSRCALRGRTLHNQNDSTSFHVNTINPSGLHSSSDGDSGGGTQSKEVTASTRARVKTVPGRDTGILETDNLDRGEV